MTSDELYSIQQVADRLGLHPRTVRNYVREGRLKAVRVGKQYRIAATDLAALTGQPSPSLAPEVVRRERHVEVSSIVDIDAISPETTTRITNLLLGAANTRRSPAAPLRIETIYDAGRGRLKVILVGDLDACASMHRAITMVLEN